MDMTKKWQTGAELSASFTVEVGDLDEAGMLCSDCILRKVTRNSQKHTELNNCACFFSC